MLDGGTRFWVIKPLLLCLHSTTYCSGWFCLSGYSSAGLSGCGGSSGLCSSGFRYRWVLLTLQSSLPRGPASGRCRQKQQSYQQTTTLTVRSTRGILRTVSHIFGTAVRCQIGGTTVYIGRRLALHDAGVRPRGVCRCTLDNGLFELRLNL